MKKIVLIGLLLGFAAGGFGQAAPKREMRAVWIATVENIDWPSVTGLTTEQQQREMIEILDHVKAFNMNTVVFQIRPDADALYASPLEPWSEWLSGRQGAAPDPWYDPLEFAISECRKRGLDIHVWFNPYRAIQNIDKTVAAPNHVTNTHPEWIVTYGNKRYFDPGIPEAREFVARVVSDVVRRYDIDAVHFDDYFYPYKIAGVNFPDDSSFERYPNGYSADRRDDWRRNNVDLIIKQLSDSIKSIKPTVEFGISPFGVWRNQAVDPAGSATRAGVTNYDDLYADILKWQKEGWIDYVTPQLYWFIGKEVADYAILADWWAQNSLGCQLYIGQAFYLLNSESRDPAWRTADEIVKQVKLNRSIPQIAGSMFFSAKYLKSNPLGIKEQLLRELYRYPALTPVNNRITPVVPAQPQQASFQKKGRTFQLEWEKGNNNAMFVIYKFKKRDRPNLENPENIVTVTAEKAVSIDWNRKTKPTRYNYWVTALSATHHESQPVLFEKSK